MPDLPAGGAATNRSISSAFAVAMMAASVAPLPAQISDETPAALLRARPDPRLYVATESSLSPEMIMPRTLSLVPEDSPYDNYALLGAVIGGVTTGLAGSLYLCRHVENCNLGLALLVGTPVFGLPGFVLGGLIGAGFKKPPKDPVEDDDPNNEDEAAREDPPPLQSHDPANTDR